MILTKETRVIIRKCRFVILGLAIFLMICSFNEHVHAEGSIQTQLDSAGQDEELNILFVGNSLSVDTTKYAAEIAAAAGYTKVQIGNCHILGATLKILWEAIDPKVSASEATINFLNDLENPYTYSCVKTTKKGTTTITTPTNSCTFLDVMQDSDWDIVILNERSHYAGIPDGTILKDNITTVDTGKYLLDFKNYIHEFYPDAKIGYEQTWAYEPGYTDSVFSYFNYDHNVMFQGIVSKISELWDNEELALDVIIPTGTAFENARTSYLNDYMSRDGKHASYDYGRVLAAMTFLSSCGLDLGNVTDVDLGSHSVSSLHMNLLKKCVSDALTDPTSVSDEMQTDIPKMYAPILTTTVSDSAIRIKWKAVSGATKYQVQRLQTNGKYKTVKTYKAGSSTYTYLRSRSANGYYRYRVIVVGDSLIANTKSGTFTTYRVQPTSDLTGTNRRNSIKLSWKKQSGVTGYLVYRCKPGGTYKKYARITSASKHTFTDTAVSKAGKYKYKVRSYLKFNGKYYYGKYAAVSLKRW